MPDFPPELPACRNAERRPGKIGDRGLPPGAGRSQTEWRRKRSNPRHIDASQTKARCASVGQTMYFVAMIMGGRRFQPAPQARQRHQLTTPLLSHYNGGHDGCQPKRKIMSKPAVSAGVSISMPISPDFLQLSATHPPRYYSPSVSFALRFRKKM
jgi:hypothetical protein